MLKTIRFAALVAGASFMAVPAAAQDSSAIGTWDTQAVTDFGTFGATLIIAEGEGGHTVEMIDQAPEGGAGGPGGPPPAMESTISDVVVDGSSFSFSRSMTTPQGAMNMAYAGSVEGDALTAQVTTDFGAIPVTGTRAEAGTE